MKRIVLCVGLLGCGPNYDRTDFGSPNKKFPVEDATKQRIIVAKGGAVAVRIESFNSSKDTMSDDITSDDASVMAVVPSITDHNYVFLGMKPGRTNITIKADGDLVLVVPAFVIEQPLP